MQIVPVLEADNEGSPSILSTHWLGSRVTDFTIALGSVWKPYSRLSIGVAGLERVFDGIARHWNTGICGMGRKSDGGAVLALVVGIPPRDGPKSAGPVRAGQFLFLCY